MALQAPFTITINPLKDVVDISQGKIVGTLKGYPVTPGGVYTLSYVSNIYYCGTSLLVNKAVVYNTTDNNPGGWMYLVDSGASAQTIQIGTAGTQCGMLYAFVVDITSQDNTGSGILTVTQIA
jgi:hypothetical protein